MGGSNSRDTTILFSSNRIESKSRLPPSQNTGEKWNDGEGIGNRFRWATNRRIDRKRKEKKRKRGEGEKRIREKKGKEERKKERRGGKHRANRWKPVFFSISIRRSWISRVRIYTTDRIFLEPRDSTSWKISETWMENCEPLVKKKKLLFESMAGIDSALGTTILFNSKRRYRLPGLLFTEHGSPSVEVVDKSNKLSPPTLDRVFRDTWRASKPRVSATS